MCMHGHVLPNAFDPRLQPLLFDWTLQYNSLKVVQWKGTVDASFDVCTAKWTLVSFGCTPPAIIGCSDPYCMPQSSKELSPWPSAAFPNLQSGPYVARGCIPWAENLWSPNGPIFKGTSPRSPAGFSILQSGHFVAWWSDQRIKSWGRWKQVEFFKGTVPLDHLAYFFLLQRAMDQLSDFCTTYRYVFKG